MIFYMSINLKENISGIFQGLFQVTCDRVTDRKARGPQEAGGNKWRTSCLELTSVFLLMEMFFLSYVKEAMYLL